MKSQESSKDLIGYQRLIQSAMKNVFRSALEKGATLGSLPGAHHFYITFRTRTPGVTMADYLKDKFPEEMTIVIQHQYWDLEVHDDRFEIILQFTGVPQHLRIPFAAVTRFSDPSVGLMLQFDENMDGGATGGLSLPDTQPAAAASKQAASGSTGAETVVSLDAFRRK